MVRSFLVNLGNRIQKHQNQTTKIVRMSTKIETGNIVLTLAQVAGEIFPSGGPALRFGRLRANEVKRAVITFETTKRLCAAVVAASDEERAVLDEHDALHRRG